MDIQAFISELKRKDLSKLDYDDKESLKYKCLDCVEILERQLNEILNFLNNSNL